MGRAKKKKEEELGRGGAGRLRKTLGEDVSSDEAAEEDSWRGCLIR